VIPGEAASSLELLLRSGSDIQALTYKIGSRTPAAIQARGSRDSVLNIPIPQDIETGLQRLEIKAADIYQRETVLEACINVRREGQTAPESFVWVQPDLSLGGGRILLSADALIGVYSGGALGAAEINGFDAGMINVSVDEYGRLNIRGSTDGNCGPFSFSLTTVEGKKFTSQEFSFLVDRAAPEIVFVENPDNKWVQNSLDLRFRVRDANRIKAVEFSIDLGGSWRPLLRQDEIESLYFDRPIERALDLSAFADGAIGLNVRVIDEANKETVKTFVVHKDTKAPEARLIVPISGARVNGTIRMGIAVKEMGRIASVAY
jgi:hypothetical protein